MEDRGALASQGREHARPNPLTRTASRSTTSSSRSLMTSQSANSSWHRALPSPQSTAPSSHNHRFHHTNCHASPSDRPRFNLSRERSDELRKPPAPVSTLLEERLQKERKAEAERKADTERSSLRQGDAMSSLAGSGTSQASPARSHGSRPRSSGGGESCKQNAMGVREMEQTLSSLHKENFNLKLEVHHRREKQTALEERLKEVEASKAEVEEVNDQLMDELEKRDKALQEAVAMIVVLEAQNDQLLQERETVRQVEADGFYASGTASRTSLSGPSTPKPRPLPTVSDAKVIDRMPSFLTDFTENTENLRNVYLGGQSSMVSVHRLSEDTEEGGLVGPQRTTSPSLSVLSESSFISVYGSKWTAGRSEAPVERSGLDGLSETSLRTRDSQGPTLPCKQLPSAANRSNSGSIPSASFNDVLMSGPSPLDRIARLEKTFPGSRDDGSSGRASRFGHSLPPTPDTIFDSSLPRHEDSHRLPKASDAGNSTSAMHGRQHEAVSSVLLESRFGLGARPRSAGDTTISQNRALAGWETDDSLDDLDGGESVAGLDVWMREGLLVSEKGKTLDPLSSVSQAGGGGKLPRASPDLFSFPSAGGGWATNSMFGRVGANVMGASLQTPASLADDHTPPPPPNRRSSLKAMFAGSVIVGSGTVGVSPSRSRPASANPRKDPARGGSRVCSNLDVQTADVGFWQNRVSTVPSQLPPTAQDAADPTTQQPPPPSKQRHYPPTASQPPRRGLNSLFRRSTGSSVLPPSTPTTETTRLGHVSTVGIPSWVRRNDVAEEDRTGATPPPIMRKRAWTHADDNVLLAATEDGGAAVGQVPGMTTHLQLVPPGSAGSALPQAGGQTRAEGVGKKKWFSVGKVGSLRNRAG